MKTPTGRRVPPVHHLMGQAEFIAAFGEAAEQWDDELADNEKLAPAFALVLGAGASRSAGIPPQGEMTAALEHAYQAFLKRNPGAEFDPAPLLWWDELETDLFMACMARAKREPNLTHLLAADLAAVGLIGPILTTNFDDLALAGFWALPERTMHVEPHVVYDVKRTPPPRRIRRGVPLVLKAHGHHTTYSVARFEAQVRRLSPSVVNHYRRNVRPRKGFIVAGYSGAWNDGILAIFGRKEFVQGKVIYWLYRGHPPDLEGRLKTIAKTCDIRFVQIDDCDAAFMRLWEAVKFGCPYLAHKMLEPMDLLAPFPMTVPQVSRYNLDQPRPWRHGIKHFPGVNNERYWALPALKALQAKWLPVLREMEQLDPETLHVELYRLVRDGAGLRPTRTRDLPPEDDDYDLTELRLDDLKNKLPAGLEWTRRKRVVYRMAIDGSMDFQHSIALLEIIQGIGAQAHRRPRKP